MQNDVLSNTPSKSLSECIPDTPDVKQKLRQYPDVFSRIWPDELVVEMEKVVDEGEEMSDTGLSLITKSSGGGVAGRGGGRVKRRRGAAGAMPAAAGGGGINPAWK